MGIIAASIGNGSFSCKRIPRGKQKLASETTAGKAIKIQQYLQDGKKALALTSFKPIADLAISKVATSARTIDLLWQMGYEFKKQQPSWSGFMQKYLNGDHSGKATVTFLPIINLNPSDESCIYFTLLFVKQQA